MVALRAMHMTQEKSVRGRLGDYFIQRKRKGRSGLPVLSVTINDGIVRRNSLGRKVESDLTAEDHLLVQPGDLVYNMMRMWQGAMGIAREEGIVSPAYVVCSPKTGVDPDFFFEYLKTPKMLKRLEDFSGGLTGDRLRLYFKDFASIPAFVPDYENQKLIARMSSTWAAAARSLCSLTDAKSALYNGLLNGLLAGTFRFTTFGTPARQGSLPPGWKYSKLRDLASMNSSIVPEDTDPSYEFYYLELSDVDKGNVHLPRERITFRNAPSRARRLVRNGDVLMATVRPNLLGYGRYLGGAGNLVASTGFVVLEDNGVADMSFVYHLLYSHGVQRQLAGLVLGSGYPAVSESDIRLLKVAAPPKSEQVKIGKVLDSLKQEILLLGQIQELLQSQRRAVLQGLLAPEMQARRAKTGRGKLLGVPRARSGGADSPAE